MLADSPKSFPSPVFEDDNYLRNYRELKRIPITPVQTEVDFRNYTFDNEVSGKEGSKPEATTTQADTSELEFPTQRLYRLNFRPDNTVLQLNNMFLNGQYQLFNGGPYINAGVGVNTKIGIVDLMEDHRIYGGFRFSGDLIEYSLSYQNLEKRLDKEYIVTRTRQRLSNAFNAVDVKTLQAALSLRWPFSEVTSIRGVINVRNDRIIPLSVNEFNLRLPINNEYWGVLKAAYVFDNTREIALNIRYGTRFKFFAEYYKQVYNEQETEMNEDLTVLGFDVRHYQKIHREFILVSRLAGSTSFGSTPLIYYLGGVDELWKADQFNENTPIDLSQNYRYQALAANMRGFLQNIRNGSSFAVWNNELRLPVFSYFIHRPIQSSFIRNFQIVGFADVGTAWVGESPLSDDNPIRNETISTGQITVTYEDINQPVVAGIGGGLRTTLLGYFVRADWGWGIENGAIADKPLFMFSLSLDI
jgi:hypothetical protein